MSLPFEITTLPPQAIDILRYLGRLSLEQADADTIMGGTGLTERSFSKGIKRLVTKNYMSMDSARVYHLTQKGSNAIADITKFDAETGGPIRVGQDNDSLEYDLCVVVPPGTYYVNEAGTLMLGLEPIDIQLSDEVHLVIRLDCTGGDISHREFTASISPDLPVVIAEFDVIPDGTTGAFRLRVEAFQSVRMDSLEEAGGMYFDIPLGQALDRPQAMHAYIDIIE
jgi:predicted transcriptional regulator